VRHLAELTRRALRIVGDQAGDDLLARRVAAANHIAEAIAAVAEETVHPGAVLADSHDVLLGIAASPQPDGNVVFPQRPDIPLSTSALLVNGRDQPQIGREIGKELASADRVDLLCAFVKWYGLRLIEDALSDFIARSGVLRVITTTYMGATGPESAPPRGKPARGPT
jgi:hypothetical protein